MSLVVHSLMSIYCILLLIHFHCGDGGHIFCDMKCPPVCDSLPPGPFLVIWDGGWKMLLLKSLAFLQALWDWS